MTRHDKWFGSVRATRYGDLLELYFAGCHSTPVLDSIYKPSAQYAQLVWDSANGKIAVIHLNADGSITVQDATNSALLSDYTLWGKVTVFID